MKININEDKILGAIGVLENYIIGALADYEQGQIEETTCLEDSIYIYKILTLVSTHGFSALTGCEYEERFLKAREAK